MKIHPTAIIDPKATLAADVQVGPFCVVDGAVEIGSGCRLDASCRIIGPLSMGQRNTVHSYAVLGDTAQDLKYRGESSRVTIGDDNIFREGVTVHRAVGHDGVTAIGDRCYLMANSHVGHNARLGNDVALINGALIGGHADIADRAIVGGNCAVHQFCRVGRMAMISNSSSHNTNIPPFVIVMVTNKFLQLNVVGLRRGGVPSKNINALKAMFQFLYRTHGDKPLARAIEMLPPELAEVPEVREHVAFSQQCKRALARFEPWSGREKEKGGVAED